MCADPLAHAINDCVLNCVDFCGQRCGRSGPHANCWQPISRHCLHAFQRSQRWHSRIVLSLVSAQLHLAHNVKRDILAAKYRERGLVSQSSNLLERDQISIHNGKQTLRAHHGC